LKKKLLNSLTLFLYGLDQLLKVLGSNSRLVTIYTEAVSVAGTARTAAAGTADPGSAF